MMKKDRALIVLVALVFLCGPSLAEDGSAGTSLFEGYSCPQYQGPDGNFRPKPASIPLTDKPGNVVVHWNGPYNMGIGKTGSQHLNYDYVNKARQLGLKSKDDLIHGGANSAIAAEGKVFVSYFVGKPPYSKLQESGKHPRAPKTFFGIQADDVLVALDAETGEVAWKAVEENGGIQIGGGKRYNWHCSPAYADGKVFTINPLEQVRAYDAENGKRLWQTKRNPKLEAFRQKRLKSREHIGYRADQNEGLDIFETSLMVADGAVITPVGKVFDANTGELLWKDRKGLLGTQYTFWGHGGKEYILTISGLDRSTLKSRLRLIEPRTGKLLWEFPVLAQGQPPLFFGDVCIAMVNESETLPGYALQAGLKLSPDRKPELLWELPDNTKTVVGYGPGRGVMRQGCIGDGVAVLMVRDIKPGRYNYPKHKVPDTVAKPEVSAWIERHSKRYASLQRDKHFMVVRMKDGKILSRIDNEEAGEKILGFASYFLDRNHLLLFGDTRHSGRFFTLQYYRVNPDNGDWTFLGRVPVDGKPITGYHTTMESPVVNGNVYIRTYQGVARYDFRRRDPSQTFSVRAKGLLGWGRSDLLLDLVSSRDGTELVGGTVRPAGGGRDSSTVRPVPIDCGELVLDGNELTGKIRTPVVNGQKDLNTIEIKLGRSGKEKPWTGSVRRIIEAYEKPVKVSGDVSLKKTALARDTAKLVIGMDGAIAPRKQLASPEKRRGVALTLLRRGEKTLAANAYAGRLNVTSHEVFVDSWAEKGDRIQATVTIVYHDDVHYHHNPQTKGPTAARYKLDLKRTSNGAYEGSYSGQVGVAYKQTVKIDG